MLQPFEVIPCLYREAMHLQCFPPTRYVRGVATNVTTFTHFAQNWSLGCLVVLYGSTMLPAQLRAWWFPNNFFCLVWAPCYTLITHQVEKKKKKKIHGGFRSTWGDNFFMGTQNGSKLEIWPWGILIHTLELKLQPFEVIPWLYREAIHLQCFMRMRYVINGEYPFRTRTYYADDLYSIWSKLEYRLPTCIVWLYYTSSLTMRRFPDNFFLLSVWTPWKNNKLLINSEGNWEPLGTIFAWVCRMDQMQRFDL